MTDIDFMKLAIETAREGMKRGQAPFGACIVKDGLVVSCVHNDAFKTVDITAHAEIQAIRNACSKLNDLHLPGCVIYSTCEPCPMCFSACYWANLSRIVYGARIEDAERIGIRQIPITAQTMHRLSKSAMDVKGDVLRDESVGLFVAWSKSGNRRVQ